MSQFVIYYQDKNIICANLAFFDINIHIIKFGIQFERMMMN